MDRRRLLVTALGVGTATVASPWLGGASAASEDDLSFAYFGYSAELLLADFYANAVKGGSARGLYRLNLLRGRSTARQHVRALADLLVGAGEMPPTEDDFAFQWPVRTFVERRRTVTTGLDVLRALQGAHQTAAVAVSEPSYRVLFASLAVSAGQQIGVLTALTGEVEVEPFPVAVDLETASGAVERYLG